MGPEAVAPSFDSSFTITALSVFRDDNRFEGIFEDILEDKFDAELEVEAGVLGVCSGLEVAAASFNDEVEDCFDDEAEPKMKDVYVKDISKSFSFSLPFSFVILV